MTTFGGHPNNPGESPQLEILLLIISAKSLCHVRSRIHRFWGLGCCIHQSSPEKQDQQAVHLSYPTFLSYEVLIT